MTYGDPAPFTLPAIAAAWFTVMVYQRVREYRRVEPGTIEHAKQQYAEGEIDLRELERRVDVLADPEAERIREATERVSGIGEATSFAIAAEFETLREVREADAERLTELPNVGEQRAANLKDHL